MRLFRTEATRHSASRQVTPRFRPAFEALEDRLVPTTSSIATSAIMTAPTLLTVTPASATSATLTWTNVANETGYTILLWNGTTGVPLTSVAAGVTTATVTGLPGGQEAWLSVEAVDATSVAQSPWVSVSLPQTAVSAAAALVATPVSTTEVNLTWTIGTGQTGFNVLEWNGTQAVTVATVPASQRHYAVTALSPGTQYYFAVEAYNASNSVTTAWVSATTLPQPITAPTNLTGKATDTQITLNWTAGTGATGYSVFEYENDQDVQVGTTNATTTQYVVTGLTPGTGYWFYVQAYNPSNEANSGWKFIATTDISDPLPAPTDVTAKNLGGGQVQLNWTASTGAVGYYVYNWTGTSWKVVASPDATADSAVITGLSKTTQYFVVMAYTADAVQYADSAVVKILV